MANWNDEVRLFVGLNASVWIIMGVALMISGGMANWNKDVVILEVIIVFCFWLFRNEVLYSAQSSSEIDELAEEIDRKRRRRSEK